MFGHSYYIIIVITLAVTRINENKLNEKIKIKFMDFQGNFSYFPKHVCIDFNLTISLLEI